MSVIKKERECSGYSNVVSGTGDIVKRDNQEASFRGTSNTRLFRVGELGPYNPVGRNKLPKKSKREQKILERLIITKAIVSKENYLFEKETATSSVTKASAKRTAH